RYSCPTSVKSGSWQLTLTAAAGSRTLSSTPLTLTCGAVPPRLSTLVPPAVAVAAVAPPAPPNAPTNFNGNTNPNPALNPDDGFAMHYGDPLREQRVALAEGGVVDRSHRGVIRVAGADRLGWLHSLTSQHLEQLEPDCWTEALVLSPHGHVEHHLVLRDDGEATWIHVEPGQAQGLIDYLQSMKVWS